jgi:hypothetical protein
MFEEAVGSQLSAFSQSLAFPRGQPETGTLARVRRDP